jgi:hypothetical protein
MQKCKNTSEKTQILYIEQIIIHTRMSGQSSQMQPLQMLQSIKLEPVQFNHMHN